LSVTVDGAGVIVVTDEMVVVALIVVLLAACVVVDRIVVVCFTVVVLTLGSGVTVSPSSSVITTVDTDVTSGEVNVVSSVSLSVIVFVVYTVVNGRLLEDVVEIRELLLVDETVEMLAVVLAQGAGVLPMPGVNGCTSIRV
jgi:hypothetical protein